MVSVVTKMRGRKKHPESLDQSGGFLYKYDALHNMGPIVRRAGLQVTHFRRNAPASMNLVGLQALKKHFPGAADKLLVQHR